MRLKLDENIGVSAAAFLHEQGHDVLRVTDEALSGASDEVVWQHVCQEKRMFITLDARFSDRRRYPPGTHAGIVLLWLKSRSRDAVTFALRRLLDRQPLERFASCLVVVDEHRTRLVRPKSPDVS